MHMGATHMEETHMATEMLMGAELMMVDTGIGGCRQLIAACDVLCRTHG